MMQVTSTRKVARCFKNRVSNTFSTLAVPSASFIETDASKIKCYGGMNEETFRIFFEKMCPFTRGVLKVQLLTIEPGKLTINLPFDKSFVGNKLIPCLHGGVTASLIDHAGGFAAWSSLKSSTKLLNTVDLRIDYLKPAPCQDIYCEAFVVDDSSGRLLRSDIVCYSDKTKTTKIAIGRGLYNVYDNKFGDMDSLIRSNIDEFNAYKA